MKRLNILLYLFLLSLGNSLSVHAQETPEQCQTIDFPAGWSMFSTYIVPNENLADDVFYSLIASGNLIIVKNSNGGAFLHSWGFDNVSPVNIYEGYFIKTVNAQTFDICGEQALPEENPILLHEDWNIMPYLRTEPANAIAILEDIVKK